MSTTGNATPPMQCVILAGGLATRMLPLTAQSPKYLLPVLGVPFAHHQLSLLARQGVKDVVLCVGHLADQISSYVGDGSRWGLRVRCSADGVTPLGTGGALGKALDAGLLNPEFLVMYGDSYLALDLAAVWAEFHRRGVVALMTVAAADANGVSPNTSYQDGRILGYDKNSPPGMRAFLHVDYGVSVLTRDVVQRIISPGRTMDLAQVFTALIGKGTLAGLDVGQRFHEVGSTDGLRRLEEYLSARVDP